MNKKDQVTYIPHNRKNTIDLVFTNRKHINPAHQRIKPVVIRKHLLLETYFALPQTPQQKMAPVKASRRLAPEKLEEVDA